MPWEWTAMAWDGIPMPWEASPTAWEGTPMAWESIPMAWGGIPMSAKCLTKRFLGGISRFGSELRLPVGKKRQPDAFHRPSCCSEGAAAFGPRSPSRAWLAPLHWTVG